MTDPAFYMTMASASLGGVAILTTAALSGWRGWLRLKHEELQFCRGPHAAEPTALPNATARIEIADLKERIRKLEAIAAGVEL